MPLVASTLASLKDDIAKAPSDTAYVIVSSKPLPDGRAWCGACVEAAPEIERVFQGDGTPYGLEVKFLPQELRTDDNWLYHDWKLIGVPTIYRVTRGARAGTPISYSEDGFGKELEAFTTGPEAFDAYLKKTKGDDYKDDDALWAAHLVEFDEVEELIRKHVESEKAKKLKEAKEPEVVCTDGVCTIKPGSGRVRS